MVVRLPPQTFLGGLNCNGGSEDGSGGEKDAQFELTRSAVSNNSGFYFDLLQHTYPFYCCTGWLRRLENLPYPLEVG